MYLTNNIILIGCLESCHSHIDFHYKKKRCIHIYLIHDSCIMFLTKVIRQHQDYRDNLQKH